MNMNPTDMLGEVAADAALERKAFLADATAQLRRFLDSNASRIREAGGLVLIDEDPDYLAVAPDMSFRVAHAVPGGGDRRVDLGDGGHRVGR